MLKIDFHTHTSEDVQDNISYSAFRLIDRAAELGYDAVAITNHHFVHRSKELDRYAEEKDLLLIPGVELTLSKKHVLVINPQVEPGPGELSLKDLPLLAHDKSLVIAPHPFYPQFKSLKKRFFRYHDCFGAIEFSAYHNHVVNPNRKAGKIAALLKKPLVGSSDCHNLWQFGTTYSLVDAEKNTQDIIDAVKRGKVSVEACPLSMLTMVRVATNFVLSDRLGLPFRI